MLALLLFACSEYNLSSTCDVIGTPESVYWICHSEITYQEAFDFCPLVEIYGLEEQTYVADMGGLVFDKLWWVSGPYGCSTMGIYGGVSPAECGDARPFICEFTN